MFKLLKSTEIITDKWNECVANAHFSNLLGNSWFLDSVCPAWYGVVNDDYSIVLPLCVSSKFGRLKAFNPPLISQNAIYYKHFPSLAEQIELVKFLESKFFSIDLTLNKFSNFNALNSEKIPAYYLELNEDYNDFSADYSTILKENIIKIKNEKYYLIIGILPNEVISFLNSINFFEDEQYYNYLRRLLAYLLYKRKGAIYTLFSKDNEPQGVGIFLSSLHSTEVLLLASRNDDEIVKAYIIDRFVKNNSGTAQTLYLGSEYANLWQLFNAKKYYNYHYTYKRKGMLNFFGKKK